MHELPMVEKIVAIALKQARLNGASKVLSLTIETGPLSDLEPEWMNYYFQKMNHSTLLETTKLIVKKRAAPNGVFDGGSSYILKEMEIE